MNFYASLLATSDRNPDAPCLIRPGADTLSYRDLTHSVDAIAGALLANGVEPGDRVLAQIDKSAENVALYLATLKTGGVYVPINSGYTVDEVSYFLGDSGPRLFVCTPVRADEIDAGGTAVLTLDGAGGGSLMAAAQSTAASEVVARDDGDLAAILYTSGTTGRSKGAMLTHGNMASNTRALLDIWGWRDDDVLLHALPVFHVHGLFVALHCALLSGTPILFLPAFDAETVAGLLPEATVLMGVPTFYTRLLGLDEQRFNRETVAGMRLFISGSAPLTEQTFDEFETRTGHRVLERYGMSETLMNTSNPLTGERVAGTVGFALPDVDVRIADQDGGVLPRGDVGGIEVRGPNVFSGYWRMPEKTAEEIRADGFFVTGDMGVMDADGRVSIVGRAKDLVISGGYNVYPKEVEKLIDEMPGVVESAVIGVPHSDFGEAVVAVVVPAGEPVSLADVERALGGHLARFKQPKRVVNVASLPRNTMGKVQKNVLRDDHGRLFDPD